MIRNLIVYINSDRSVFPKELKIANQFEIKTNEIKFIFDGDIPRTGYPYLILTNRNGSFYLPLVDDSVVFGSQETWIMGGWSAHIMISEAEIINGIVNKSEKLFISDDFGLWVEPSDINIDDLKEQQLPTPLKLLYDELLVLKKELEDIVDQGPSGEGNDGATFIPNVSPEGVISWTNDKKLPNPDPVNIKGPAGYTPVKGVDYFDGKDGMSAYELALQEGFVGTLDDWLNSLKGDPGPAYTLTAIDKAAITASVKTEIDPELEELKESIEDLPDSYSKEESDNKYQPKGSYEASGTSESKVSEHNASDKSHNDIRLLIQGLTDRLNAFLDTDDTTLDQISELVAYINSNKSLIDSITTSKVNVSDIVDNLTTNVSNKPLSAKQAVALKSLIDTLQNSLNSHTGDTTKHINAEERKTWNAKSDFSGSYSDLKNIPTEFNPASHNHDDKYQPKGSYEASGTADIKVNEHNKSISAHADIRKEVSVLKESIADLTLGIASDGLIYLFVDGQPQGTGIPQGKSGDVFGYIDENNTIVLEGELSGENYNVKYKMADGTLIDIGELSFVAEPTYTNLANPKSSEWQTDKRINSSFNTVTQVGNVITNLIAWDSSYTSFHVKGLKLKDSSTSPRLYCYNASKVLQQVTVNLATIACKVSDYADDVYIVTPKEASATYAYYALGGALVGSADDVIITIDENIE